MNQIEKTLTSMEVAKMVEKDHKELLRDIRRYVEQLAESKIALGDFFNESTYIDANKQERPCYKVTKKGCEFIAHKLTGVKGAKFTAQYINRFHEMEEQLNKPKSTMELLEIEFAAIKEVDSKVEAVNKDLQDFKMDLPILGIEIDRITGAVHKRGVQALGGKESNAYNDRSLRGKVYSDIYRELKRQFGVTTYKAIKRNQCDLAISVIDEYELPYVLSEQIKDYNTQINMDVA